MKNRKISTTLNTEMHRKFMHYVKGADARGFYFDLSEKQFQKLWGQPCIYCGSKIETIGIDRVDSEKDYESDNVVPCCSKCNKFKLINPPEEYYKHCLRVADHFDIEEVDKWRIRLL